MTALVVFDDGLGRLAPMTDLRAAFAIRTGAFTTLERICRAVGEEPAALLCPEDVAALEAERADCPVNELPRDGDLLLVSGRCVLPPEGLEALQRGDAIVERSAAGPEVVAARLDAAAAARFVQDWAPPQDVRAVETAEACLIRLPEDVIRFRNAAMERDLATFIEDEEEAPALGVVRLGEFPVCVDPTAELFPMVVLDASKGPIVIEADAVVRPGAVVCGPAYIGAGSTVIDRAHIKPHTAIGPMCKVGGEVGGAIFQGWSNKAHDGHLGDSWVGEWANFGAGTVNSNLLNTYGEVAVRSAPDEPRRRSGLTFLGAIVGDHVKFAIGTRIMTGSVSGTGAMIATTAPPDTAVPPFAWLTDGGAQEYRLEKFLEVARSVMARRDIEPSDAYLSRLRALHAAAGRGAGRGSPRGGTA